MGHKYDIPIELELETVGEDGNPSGRVPSRKEAEQVVRVAMKAIIHEGYEHDDISIVGYEVKKVEARAPIYCYRTLELDEDGDPYDHGVVRAHTRREAAKFVSERLQEVAPGAAFFKLYPLVDVEEDGVLGSDQEEFITKHWASDGREC